MGVPHPMHPHGFYFDSTSRGTWAADTSILSSPTVVDGVLDLGGTDGSLYAIRETH